MALNRGAPPVDACDFLGGSFRVLILILLIILLPNFDDGGFYEG